MRIKTIIFQLTLLISYSLCTYTIEHESLKSIEKPIIVFVDLDNVVSKKLRLSFFDFKDIFAKMICFHPISTAKCILDCLYFKALINKGYEFSKEPNISFTSIVSKTLDYAKDNGYGNFSLYKETIINRSIKPEPLNDMINLLNKLKKNNHSVQLIAATNQEYDEFIIYREKLKKYNIDLNTIFDGVLTTYNPLKKHSLKTANDVDFAQKMDGNVYMTHDFIKKPDSRYYEAARKIAQKINPNTKQFIHIDDKLENIKGAENSNIEGIHFELPTDNQENTISARKASPQEILYAVNKVKESLESKGLRV